MKNVVFISILAMLVIVSTASANLLYNGDMEISKSFDSGVWPDGFQDRLDHGSWIASGGIDNSACLAIMNYGGGGNYTFQQLDISKLSAGMEIEFGAYYKVTEDWTANDWQGPRLAPSSGFGGGTVDPAFKIKTDTSGFRNITPGEWTLLSGTWTVPTLPEDLSSEWVRFDLVFDVDSGLLYMDNAYVTPEPATMVLLGLGSLLGLRRKRS